MTRPAPNAIAIAAEQLYNRICKTQWNIFVHIALMPDGSKPQSHPGVPSCSNPGRSQIRDRMSAFEEACGGDAATSWALLSTNLQARLRNKDAWAKSGVTKSLGDGSIEVGKATINGDTATVTIKGMKGGTEVISEEVSLVKESGAWKVEMP